MFSEIIFQHLFNDAAYLKKYSPYFKKEYFHNLTEKIIFTLIDAYYRSYSKNPSYAAIKHEITKLDNINELAYNESMTFVDSIESRGCDRIVPIGKALDFSPIWDGFDLLSVLTRIITID